MRLLVFYYSDLPAARYISAEMKEWREQSAQATYLAKGTLADGAV